MSTNDPFQVFEVEHEPCTDLQIVVRKGEGITKGHYKDFFDIPDPYVILRIPGSSNSSKRTSHVDNNVNPIWDETFHFYLDPKKDLTLEITLMDANHIQDDTLGLETLKIGSLPLDTPCDHVFEFAGGSKVHTTIVSRKNQTPDLRFSIALCEEEKDFMKRRRQIVLGNMQKLLQDEAPKTYSEVPIIAVLGSGGGFRAMICLSAAVKVLRESGLLDCASYISGLSGSSWFISTLYAHDLFPHVTSEQIFQEIKTSVTQNWKWNIMNSHKYFLDMMQKSRSGQPVSFTDVFGHLLGDILLKGKKQKKLSDQRRILEKGEVPMPLYTSLHVKGSVSCKAFSEWIEFSPYEIGIAKYGTFMKTESFGSKFLLGKMIKQFTEFPLHYLQGVWGSAFTVLMKKAFDGGSKKDIVQMMREGAEERDLNDQLESECLNEGAEEKDDSDSDDHEDVDGADDDTESDSGDEEEKEETPGSERKSSEGELKPPRKMSAGNESSNSSAVTSNSKKTNKATKKGFSFDFKLPSFDFGRKSSQGTIDPGNIDSKAAENGEKSKSKGAKIQRRGAVKENATTNKPPDQAGKSNYWQKKKKDRKSEKEHKSIGIQNWLKNSGVLNSRAGRAGEILNPFRGLSLVNTFPISPFASSAEEEEEVDDMTDNANISLSCRYEPLDNTAKKLFIIDSGLAFNSPYPLLLRPQRAVDMYISFDFSQRGSDKQMPFKELILAEKWARQNKVLFPPIEKLANEFSKDPEVKELYIFKDENDPQCPIILHFTLVNNMFRTYKAPGVERRTDKDIDFANFPIFDDPNQRYASLNFVYESQDFERLYKLVEFNTLLNLDAIKTEMAAVVVKKREMAKQFAQNTFLKFQNLQESIKRFKKIGTLNLKVNEKKSSILLASKLKGSLERARVGSRDSVMSYASAVSDLGSPDDIEEVDENEERQAENNVKLNSFCSKKNENGEEKLIDLSSRLSLKIKALSKSESNETEKSKVENRESVLSYTSAVSEIESENGQHNNRKNPSEEDKDNNTNISKTEKEGFLTQINIKSNMELSETFNITNKSVELMSKIDNQINGTIEESMEVQITTPDSKTSYTDSDTILHSASNSEGKSETSPIQTEDNIDAKDQIQVQMENEFHESKIQSISVQEKDTTLSQNELNCHPTKRETTYSETKLEEQFPPENETKNQESNDKYTKKDQLAEIQDIYPMEDKIDKPETKSQLQHETLSESVTATSNCDENNVDEVETTVIIDQNNLKTSANIKNIENNHQTEDVQMAQTKITDHQDRENETKLQETLETENKQLEATLYKQCNGEECTSA